MVVAARKGGGCRKSRGSGSAENWPRSEQRRSLGILQQVHWLLVRERDLNWQGRGTAEVLREKFGRSRRIFVEIFGAWEWDSPSVVTSDEGRI